MTSAPVSAAILAGGLATRLRPLTETIPKSLIDVNGEPFIVHQLRLLRENQIERVVLCVGYLGEEIQEVIGDGARFDLQVEYSFDSPKLIGTAGALKGALPFLPDDFLVLYGDSYLPIQYAPVADMFHRSGKLGLMTVYRNEGKYDTSNVVFADGEIKIYDKKQKLPEMRHIDYGLSLFKANVFEKFPADEKFDLADVMQKLVHEKQLAGYEVPERFYEMGSPAGLAELETFLKKS